MTKYRYRIVQEAENILTDLRLTVFYNKLPDHAEQHLKRLDRLKELLPQLRDMCTNNLFNTNK